MSLYQMHESDPNPMSEHMAFVFSNSGTVNANNHHNTAAQSTLHTTNFQSDKYKEKHKNSNPQTHTLQNAY
jgi:hypothetical protein